MQWVHVTAPALHTPPKNDEAGYQHIVLNDDSFKLFLVSKWLGGRQ
jgi:hypothetical protein